MNSMGIHRIFAIILATCLVSCASTARRVSEALLAEDESESLTLEMSGSLSDGPHPGPPLTLDSEDLESHQEVSSTQGPLIVEGPRRYRSLIHQLAQEGGRTLQATEDELGLHSDWQLHLVLIPLDREERPSEFNITLEATEPKLTLPILFDADAHSLAAFLADDNAFTQGIAGHEHVELSLITGKGNLKIAIDPEMTRSSWPRIRIRARSYTRWFRDGLATYAAIAWLDRLNEAAGIPRSDRKTVLFETDAQDSLADLGDAIFRWSQFREGGNTAYYEASLGLFQLLEQRFGRDQIRAWNKAIEQSTPRSKVRSDLLETGKETFGVDLRDVAKTAGA